MNGSTNTSIGNEGELVAAYTRRQAIEDGVLVDVSETAKEAGFRYPVAVTESVWNRYVRVPPCVSWQDEAGRLWDILWMLRFRVLRKTGESDQTLFKLSVQNDHTPAKSVTLKALCHGGDDGEPVITVMLPSED